MRALWSGFVVFGLVNVPVKLYSATEEARPRLHEVHAVDGARVKHRSFCSADGRELPLDQIARGWEAPDGRMVVLADEDFDHLPLPTRRQVEVLGFISEEDVDPVMYAKPYWAGPDGEQAMRPYALLVEALARSGRVAVAKLALRSRERLAVLRPRRGILCVHTLWWPEEIREPDDLSSSAPVTDRELQLAEVLIDQLAGVDIDQLHDEWAAALDQVVAAKLEGRGVEKPPEPVLAVDLMAALEASIRATGRQ
jgi:DNA end-binding protein Ku